MSKEIKITPNGIKQALDDLLNENEKLKQALKDTIESSKIIENEQNKEIERLNNIINEFEKSIDNKLKEFEDNKDYFIDETTLKDLKNELQELKGSDK